MVKDLPFCILRVVVSVKRHSLSRVMENMMDESTVVDGNAQVASEIVGDVSNPPTETQEEVAASPGAENVDTEQKDGEAAAAPAIDYQKEYLRTIKALSNLQAENAKIKAERAQSSGEEVDVSAWVQQPIPQVDAKLANHPALKGLVITEDVDGTQCVEIDGKLYAAESVARQWDISSNAARHAWEEREAERQKQEVEAKEKAAYDAKVEEGKADLAAAVIGSVQAMRAEAFPQLQGEDAELVDADLQTKARILIGQALQESGASDIVDFIVKNGEEATSKLIHDATQYAFEHNKRLFSIFGNKQFEDNQKFKEAGIVKPEGAPGTPKSKSMWQMTGDDWNEVAKGLPT